LYDHNIFREIKNIPLKAKEICIFADIGIKAVKTVQVCR